VGLSRERILDAALDLADRQGVTAVSTRRLGAALGVQGMTLYHYFPTKAALLDGMVERLLSLSLPSLSETMRGPWTEALRRFAVGLRGVLLQHPAR
jgi:AcrR family transcriptional regulator